MTRPRPLPALALAASLAAAGCSEELGPEVIPYTTASGVVLLSGRPVERGWIELQPTEGTLGDITSVPIRPDGSFRFDRAPVGESAVRLVDVPIAIGGAGRIFRNNSPIRRVTQSPPGDPMTIEIIEELLQYQKRREGSR